MRIQRRWLLGIVITAVSATVLGYVATRIMPIERASNNHQHSTQHAAQNPLAQAAASVRYTCPMHPDVVQDHPGSCPICGMHLVKLGGTSKDGGKHSDLVHVSLQTQQRMGVQLETVAVTDMHRAIHTFATIAPDESRTISVNSKMAGWIKRWHVQGIGQPIRKGQILYELYSPDLQQRQREYIDLLRRRDAMQEKTKDMNMMGPNAAMMGSLAKERFRTRSRLLAVDVPLDEMVLMEKGHRVQEVMPIRATQNGVVTAISAREGSYIEPTQTLLVYTDNSRVWAEVSIFPDQINWLKNGDEIVLTSGLDNRAHRTARISLATLQIDAASRTAKLRFPLSNVGEAFRPGAYAKASIKAGVRRTLSVPRDAVIRTGRGEFVVVSEDDGHFRSAPVEIGIEDEHSIEIRSGLKAGERIAVNGQFLLDAASSMHAMQSRFAAVPAVLEQVATTEFIKGVPGMEICTSTPDDDSATESSHSSTHIHPHTSGSTPEPSHGHDHDVHINTHSHAHP